MKTKIVIYAVTALLAAGTLFHLSTGHCLLKQAIEASKNCPMGK